VSDKILWVIPDGGIKSALEGFLTEAHWPYNFVIVIAGLVLVAPYDIWLLWLTSTVTAENEDARANSV
jgi:hypothetical protein